MPKLGPRKLRPTLPSICYRLVLEVDLAVKAFLFPPALQISHFQAIASNWAEEEGEEHLENALASVRFHRLVLQSMPLWINTSDLPLLPLV